MKRTSRFWALVGVALVVGAALAPHAAQALDLGALKLTIIPSTSDGSLLTIVGNLLEKLLGFIGIIAFFYLIWAGFTYLTAGGDDAKVKAARSTILNVIIGIMLIAVSYVLVRYVIGETKNASTSGTAAGAVNEALQGARPRQ